jgi:hypothetical protein
LMVPCGVAFRHTDLEVGGKIRCGNHDWVAEEVWEWE